MNSCTLGLDFGTSNTVLALRPGMGEQPYTLPLEPYSIPVDQGGVQVHIIPTIISYTKSNETLIGNQALQAIHTERSLPTMRWMKRYISRRSPLRLSVNERSIDPTQAGEDFIRAVLLSAIQESPQPITAAGISVPVEAFEHYEHWLASLAQLQEIPDLRLIDEPSAAILGYDRGAGGGQAHLLFDCGGGTMQAAVVRMETENSGQVSSRVLGKGSQEIGGSDIDAWIFQHFLARLNLHDYDPIVRQNSLALLEACRSLKEKLSTQEEASITGGLSPELLPLTLTREELEQILDDQGFTSALHRTVRQALQAAGERGFTESSLDSILLTGGTSLIPVVNRAFGQLFGRELVFAQRPLDAVARGAALYAAGTDLIDHIQHDYAVRYLSQDHSRYEYRIIVPQGTTFPSPEAVSRLAIKASHPGQRHLGLAIFELSRQVSAPENRLELVFDLSGAARLVPLTAAQQENRTHFWMNEANPTFLPADPPAEKGETIYEVEFQIDRNKRLLLTARDSRSQELVFLRHPVITLR